jgi:hypothetical protein
MRVTFTPLLLTINALAIHFPIRAATSCPCLTIVGPKAKASTLWRFFHAMKPALKLASCLLTEKYPLLWFARLTFGERRRRPTGQIYLVPTPYSLSTNAVYRVRESIRNVGELVTFMFEPFNSYDVGYHGRTFCSKSLADSTMNSDKVTGRPFIVIPPRSRPSANCYQPWFSGLFSEKRAVEPRRRISCTSHVGRNGGAQICACICILAFSRAL